MSSSAEINVLGPRVDGGAAVLTPEALRFLAELGRTFTGRVDELLERRREVQARVDAGELAACAAPTRCGRVWPPGGGPSFWPRRGACARGAGRSRLCPGRCSIGAWRSRVRSTGR